MEADYLVYEIGPGSYILVSNEFVRGCVVWVEGNSCVEAGVDQMTNPV
jgi:hypothetical protein